MDVLLAELEMALTYLAATPTTPTRADRNRQQAQRAYDLVLTFAPRLFLTVAEREQVEEKLAEVKRRLWVAA